MLVSSAPSHRVRNRTGGLHTVAPGLNGEWIRFAARGLLTIAAFWTDAH
jgi:hypothetical protein